MACSADLLPAMLKRLSMFVLRAKCKLEDLSTSRGLWGAVGDAALAVVGTAATWQVVDRDGRSGIRLPDAQVDGQAVPRCLIMASADAPPADAGTLDAQAWLALEALSGVARIMAATSEQFVPQMVNLELVGGVNFQKGCYPARKSWPQPVPRHAQAAGFRADRRGADATRAGSLPQCRPRQPAGLVALGGSLGAGRFDALAELKLSAASGGSLHLGQADGPALQLGALPYEVPLEAA